VIQRLIQHLGKFCGKGVSIILKLIAKNLGFVLMKISVFKSVYETIKTLKLILTSSVALAIMRLFTRFDYWALVLSDVIPLIGVD
jgi:hypothetical protein